jgi:hypothetical protein
MLNKVNKKSIFREPVAFLSIFYYFIGSLSFAGYFLALFRSKLKLPLIDWFILINLIISITVSSFLININDIFQIYRFFWGFLVFYIFFHSMKNINFNFDQLLFILIVLTIIEAILVNSIFSAEILPNYPANVDASSNFSDKYQRVYGFGGNASVLSSLLVVILCLSSQSVSLIVGVMITVMLASSGSGFIAFAIFIIFKKFKYKSSIFILLSSLIIFLYQIDLDIFSKISLKYINHLYENKILQIGEAWSDLTIFQVFFGSLNISDMGGDILWLSFFKIFGLYGTLLLLFFLYHKVNKKNFLGVLLIVIFTTHYFVLFSMPGQLIFGYLLALKPLTNDQLKPKIK